MFPESFLPVFLEVRTCSKALFRLCVWHGKSPWFSRVPFLVVVGVDLAVLLSAVANVGVFLECAYWHGQC